ncbi:MULTISPECIES: hypothetical protein [Psychromonas]|uniref:hypothetical protein n=1 Tax=Psychromonas TaxID=67572 RepID=UPI00042737B9|nr:MULTISPECIES: hypothetical protein [Psychromonas]MBB1271903.1 hypothetical protein [Psychromonas sp. SR45-3]
MSSALKEQQDIILQYLDTTHYIDTNAPTAQDKQEAKYKIGKACNKVREILCSDEVFLDWVWANVIDECPIDIEEVTPNTLNAWRMLPKFGTLEQCEIVGFTHIAKLLLEKNATMKAEVLTIIENNDPDTAKKLIKAVLKPVVDFTPIVANKKDLAETVAKADKLSKEALVALVKAMHQKMIK